MRQLNASDPILKPQMVSRRLPLNFDENDRQLFAHELEKVIPETSLLELHDVRISSDGLLFKDGKILKESFAFPFLLDEWKKRSRVKFIASNYLLRKTRKLDKTAFWIVDQWSSGYFHWLSDALSRLTLIRANLQDEILLLPHHYAQFDYVQASLKSFDVQNVEFIAPHEVVRCKRLLLPTPIAPSGHFREEIIRGVRKQLLDYFTEPSALARRVYISRAHAPKRRIVNEAEVSAALRKFDFEIIHAEDLGFAEQVRLFSQTRYLVSNHGAGLTNMLFLQSGGSVLELRHKTDRVNNCYFTLASALNLKYFYQTCDPLPDGEDAHTADLFVNVEQLARNLDQIIGK
ncbi:MAG TPA: glycosyltransferase family 61 protein [Pyrinomonadaceae bacterium]|nr:glycosyltransferase family 61 protein [Pyrinomonadaceae bacterium]